MSLRAPGRVESMSNDVNGGWLGRAIVAVIPGVLVLGCIAAAQQARPPSQMRVNDFPSVKGYDPGYPIPYDPNDPYVALKYINEQFEGVWGDIDGGNFDVTKLLSRAPQAEDYTDPNRPDP